MKQVLTVIAGVITLSLSACGDPPREATPPIEIKQGEVTGLWEHDSPVANFMGLPFAAPPVGELRWRAPEAPANFDGTFAADNFGSACMQPTETAGGLLDRIIEGHGLGTVKETLIKGAISAQPSADFSEDCLYLNIRTPNLSQDGSVKGEALPVMVWIHGGGHQFGSGDFAFYQGNDLPEKGVVLVTINYRLGVFGYLAHPALSADDPRGVSGNYGLLDQIAAMEWVQDNIAAFGGDPQNVTIFGESAGAWSVTELMAAPAAKGLFHKAIGQSGASTYHLGDLDGNSTSWIGGHENGLLTSRAMGLNDDVSAAELRALPAQDIISVVGANPALADGFHVNRDGVVMPVNVGIAFEDLNINAVPTLFGYNTDEGILFFPDDPEPTVWGEGFPAKDGAAEQQAFLAKHFGQDIAMQLLALYPLSDPDKFYDAGVQMMGDEIFGVNVRFVTEQIEAAGQDAYLYIFSRVPPSEKQTIGAFHTAEIPFVFGTHVEILGLSEDDEDLTDMMQNYWVNFARSGNPNGEGLPQWPAYSSQNWMEFGGNNGRPAASIVTDYRKEQLDALAIGKGRKLAAIRPQTPQAPAASD